MGLRLSANRMAQTLDPLLFGGIASVAGLASTFYIIGAGLGALGVVLTTWFIRLDRERVAPQALPVPSVSPLPTPGIS